MSLLLLFAVSRGLLSAFVPPSVGGNSRWFCGLLLDPLSGVPSSSILGNMTCPVCRSKNAQHALEKVLSSPTLTYPWAGCSSWNAQRDRRKWFGRVQGIGAGDDSSGLVSISEVVRFFSNPIFCDDVPRAVRHVQWLQRAGSVCVCVCVCYVGPWRSIDLNQDSRQRDSFNGLVYVHPASADS